MKDVAGKGMEGQSMIRHDGYYYLFYSAGSCCGVPCDYNVRVSRSRSVNGPFEEYRENPVLSENSAWMCTGHGTPVLHPDGRWFYLYHGYEKTFNVYTGRQALLSEIVWNKETGWPALKQAGSQVSSAAFAGTGVNATSTVLPTNSVADNSLPNVALPNRSVPNRSLPTSPLRDSFMRTSILPGESALAFADEFEQPELDLRWSWDFRNTAIDAKIDRGTLSLSGTVKAGNNSGTALCIRPAMADYEMSTEVININPSLKGLVMYGDYNKSAGFGVKGNQLIVWIVNNNKKEILKTINLKSFKAVGLKLVVNSGKILRFFFTTDRHNWSEVDLGPRAIKGLDVEFTKQWDRSARPGLIHEGKATEPAKFSFCRVSAN
jgi:beta-xylosidase